MGDVDIKQILLDNDMLAKEVAASKNVPHVISDRDMLLDYLVRSVFPSDHTQAIRKYFEGGESCAGQFADLVKQHAPGAKSILEFASGYGRVARYAKLTMPEIEWTSSDIHPEAVRFLEEKIGISAFASSHKPEEWRTDKKYDVVFALSFFSHMPDQTFAGWISSLLDSVGTGGLLIFTTHGAESLRMMKKGGMDAEFDSKGYYWHPHSDQLDLSASEYGTSAVSFQYVFNALSGIAPAELVRFQEAFWWKHQDLYVLRKTDRVPNKAPAVVSKRRWASFWN